MTKQIKQHEVLRWASLFLEENFCEPQIADILLQHHLGLNRSQFYAQMHDEIPSDIVQQFQADIKRHVKTGVPIQHVIGYEKFYGRKFTVNEHVLIPRPETEELVYHIIQLVKKHYRGEQMTIVDVGTGSGVIAITLSLEIPQAAVYATDLSLKALEIAEQNAKKHSADLTFFQGDFLQPLIDKKIGAHIIVSNPPYIALKEKDQLSRTVAKFDPSIALFAESNGLAAYEKITKQASHVLTDDGYLAFEIGHTQGKAVQTMIKSHFPQGKTNIIQDINQKDRIVTTKMMC